MSTSVGRTRAALVAAVIAVNATAVVGVHALLPGLNLFGHRSPTAVGVTAPAHVLPPRLTDALPSPAAKALAAVFDPASRGSDQGLLPGSGWRAATEVATPVEILTDLACPADERPSPAVSRSRSWVAPALPGSPATTVTVSVRAYPAGVGAAVFAGLGCAVTSRPAVPGPGVDTMIVTAGDASMLAWRRGDVVATVEAAGALKAGSAAVRALAGAVDGRLAGAIAESCVEQESVAADIVRNPIADREMFTGWQVARTVTLADRPAGSPAASAPAAPAVAIPAPTVELPVLGSLPKRPSGDVSPAVLPQPVTRPRLPDTPRPAKTAMQVQEQIADSSGPGCGWSFTAMTVPLFDGAVASRSYQAAVSAAQQSMARDWQRWMTDRDAYFAAYAAYVGAAGEYRSYVADVEQVRAAWEKIREGRAAYRQALDAYESAVTARDQFLAQQAQAQQEYDTAVQACQQVPAGDVEIVPVTCPPVRPVILDQQPPSVPEKPTPPAR